MKGLIKVSVVNESSALSVHLFIIMIILMMTNHVCIAFCGISYLRKEWLVGVGHVVVAVVVRKSKVAVVLLPQN